MTTTSYRRLGALVVAILATPTIAGAEISRTEVIDRAKAYVFHPWRCAAANLTASCAPSYASYYLPGDYLGVAYDWGGFSSLFQFDQAIASGEGAGSGPPTVYSCTTGVDCSGYVSRAWHTSSKYGTSTLGEISTELDNTGLLLPGDIFNQAGYHVALFAYSLANGSPMLYEAAFFNTDINATGGWSYVADYLPRRYDEISGTSVANPAGTLSNPIALTLPDGALNSTGDSHTTVGSPSDLLDGCAADASKNESGREIIYALTITSPGNLTVSVSDDANTDVDVHLYSTTNTNDCLARNDTTFTHPVDCGTYYVVVDTFRSSSTGESPGNYDLTVTLDPSAASCGDGPPTFDFEGELGDACAYSGGPPAPYCNPTLGADVCIYTSGTDATSFCSKACSSASDCTELGPQSCCEDLGDNEYYCLIADVCAEPPSDADAGVGPGDADASPGDSDGGNPASDDAGIDNPGDGDGGGCGCRTGRGGQRGDLGLLMMGLATLVLLRRRR